MNMQTRAVVGFFDDPESVLQATRKVRDSRFKNFDVFTPFPIHGMDEAQGLKRSWLPWVTFCAGITGAAVGFGFELWTSSVDWPVIIGGKPFNSWPAFVPVMFECTILFAALGTVAAMFAVNGLPNITKKIPDPRITNDKFAVVIEQDGMVASDEDEFEQDDTETTQKVASKLPDFDEKGAMELLKSIGASDVRAYTNEGWF